MSLSNRIAAGRKAPQVESYPRLTAATVRRSGVLDPASPGDEKMHLPVKLSSNWRVMLVLSDKFGTLNVMCTDFDSHISQIIYTEEHQIGCTTRLMFVCPHTGKRVTQLYAVNGRIGSRHVFGLRYRSQGADVADRWVAKREAIHAEALKVLDQRRLDKSVLDDVEEQLNRLIALQFGDFETLTLLQKLNALRDDVTLDARRSRKRRERLRRLGREPLRPPLRLLTTEAGLDGAHWAEAEAWAAIEPYLGIIAEQVRADLAELHRRSQSSAWPVLELPLSALEDNPVIDIRVLQRRGLIRPGCLTVWSMSWEAVGYPSGLLWLAADLRDQILPFLAIKSFEAKADGQVAARLQGISVLWPGPPRANRWAFQDHRSGKAIEVLAWRQGRFAGRSAQRLVNRSQIKPQRPPKRGRPKLSAAERRRRKAAAGKGV